MSMLLQSIPSSYNEVRAHHVVLLYAAWIGTTSFMGLSHMTLSNFMESFIHPYIMKVSVLTGGFLKSLTSMILQSMPSNYNEVRAHHIVALYVAFIGMTSLFGLSYTKLSNFLVSRTAKMTRTVVNPYIMKGSMPDWITRRAFRVQLQDELLHSVPDDAESTIDAKMIVLHQLKGFQNGVSNGAGPHFEKDVDDDDDDDDDDEDDEAEVKVKTTTPLGTELPTALYMCLGPAKKFSAGFWPDMSATTLEESEIHMMQLCCVRAGIEDGMRIVDLQCGAGSLTLYIAENYPTCHVTAICNKEAQRRTIMKQATAKNLGNIHIITCDVSDDFDNELETVQEMDLVMTTELMQHMKNYEKIMNQIKRFLKPDTGKLFVQADTHKYMSLGDTPSDDLILYCCKGFLVVDHWCLNGMHYAKSAKAWLKNLDASWKKGSLKPILAFAYGNGKELEWYNYWRLHFIRTIEQWSLNRGEEYVTSHYLLQRA